MSIVACALVPDDYTGWGGQGSPVYDSVTLDKSTQWGKIYLTSASALNSDGFGYGCLGLPFNKSLNDFSFTVVYWYNGSDTGSTTTTAPIVVHNASGTSWLVIRFIFAATGQSSTTMALYTTTDLQDSTKYTNISGPVTVSNATASNYLTVDVSGAGTANGTITVYRDAVEANPAGTKVGLGTVSVDLTDYADFNAISFHGPSANNSTAFQVKAAFVSDISLRACTVTYWFPSAIGTYSEWAGSLSTNWAIPANYSAYGTGLYASATGQRVTFSNYSLLTLAAGYQLRGVMLATSARGGTNSPTGVAPYVYNPTAKTSATGTAVSMRPSGGGSKWIYDNDLLTGSAWSLANFNLYEFGLIRTT